MMGKNSTSLNQIKKTWNVFITDWRNIYNIHFHNHPFPSSDAKVLSSLTLLHLLYYLSVNADNGPSLCSSLLEASAAEEGVYSSSQRLTGAHRAEGPPLCEEIIFSVLRRTLQIIYSNLSNGSGTLLPLSCNGDRWLAVADGGCPDTRWRGEQTPAHVYTYKHLHKVPLPRQKPWLQVIVSSRTVVLVVILNDHS